MQPPAGGCQKKRRDRGSEEEEGRSKRRMCVTLSSSSSCHKRTARLFFTLCCYWCLHPRACLLASLPPAVCIRRVLFDKTHQSTHTSPHNPAARTRLRTCTSRYACAHAHTPTLPLPSPLAMPIPLSRPSGGSTSVRAARTPCGGGRVRCESWPSRPPRWRAPANTRGAARPKAAVAGGSDNTEQVPAPGPLASSAEREAAPSAHVHSSGKELARPRDARAHNTRPLPSS